MSLPQDRKIIVSAAPISGPDREPSGRAGRQAGEEDRAAKVVADGTEVHVDQVRRIVPQYRNDHDLVGALIEREISAPIADAQAAHEAAGHRLAQANDEAEQTGLAVLWSVDHRDATARRITRLVNPELLDPGTGQAEEGADAPDAEDAGTQPLRAFRHILERKLAKNVGYVVLIALAAAEGFLNVQAFAATGESDTGSLVLAILVGIGVIGLAHRIGDCAADLLENRTRAQGRSPARLTELAVCIPFLIIGILGTALIRARFYAAQNHAHPAEHISIPTLGLVALAFMLATAAVAVSMAMRNPFADDLGRQERDIADQSHLHQEARDRVLDAQDVVSATAATLRRFCEAVDNEYRIQTTHVRQCAEEYLDGYCATARVRVVDQLPDLPAPLLVTSARAWLAAHPFGTLAPPTLPFSAAPAAVSPVGSGPAQPGAREETVRGRPIVPEATYRVNGSSLEELKQ